MELSGFAHESKNLPNGIDTTHLGNQRVESFRDVHAGLTVEARAECADVDREAALAQEPAAM